MLIDKLNEGTNAEGHIIVAHNKYGWWSAVRFPVRSDEDFDQDHVTGSVDDRELVTQRAYERYNQKLIAAGMMAWIVPVPIASNEP